MQRGLLLDALARADRPAVQLVCSTACTRDDLREAIRVVAGRWLPRSQRMLLAETARATELPGVLRALLASEDGITRGRAAHLIGLLGVVDAACELEPLLDDRNPDVRLAAARAVGQLETREGARALIRALRSGTVEPDRLVEHLAYPAAVTELLNAFYTPGFLAIRDLIAEALGLTRSLAGVTALASLLRVGGEEERLRACRALGRIGRAGDRAPARRGARRRRLARPGPGGTRVDRPRGQLVRPRARAGALGRGLVGARERSRGTPVRRPRRTRGTPARHHERRPLRGRTCPRGPRPRLGRRRDERRAAGARGMSALDGALADVNLAMLVYLVALNVAASAVIAVAWVARSRAQHRHTLVEFQTISHSELTTPLSIIVPVRDEQDEVVRSVHELLDAAYPTLEVVVVNDGSQDGTLDALRHAFSLVEVERVPRARLASSLVLGVYASPLDQRLLVLDKPAGGRADSVNAGLRFARFPLFCPVDSSMRLDRDALVRMARTFQTHPETVACRASTRIAAKGSLLASMQRVGRLRALLLGRMGSIGMLRRDTVVDAGGYDPDIAGEDLELALRLHRHCRDRRLPYRLAFVGQPVATTTASQGLRTALAQERRRQRGLIEALARHRGMLFRRRYGAIGWLALPYLSLVASLGLLGAVAGYGAAVAALAIGAVDPSLTVALAVLCVTSGLTLSLGALLLDERPRRSRLAAAAIAESIGYRQLVTLARACAAWAPRRPSLR